MVTRKSARPNNKVVSETVISFPQRHFNEPVTKDRLLEELAKVVTFKPDLLRLLRIPPNMVRGVNGKYEFFDILSIQQFPSGASETPFMCYNGKTPAPEWIKQRYLAVTEADGKQHLTFVDPLRGVFIKEELSDQASIASKLYSLIYSVK